MLYFLKIHFCVAITLCVNQLLLLKSHENIVAQMVHLVSTEKSDEKKYHKILITFMRLENTL